LDEKLPKKYYEIKTLINSTVPDQVEELLFYFLFAKFKRIKTTEKKKSPGYRGTGIYCETDRRAK
jgi:hypothetical protein